MKVIPSEECTQQHNLLVCDFRGSLPSAKKRNFTQRIHTWKFRDPASAKEYNAAFKVKVTDTATVMSDRDVEELWCKLKTTLLDAASEVCGLSKYHQWKRETWWLDDKVDEAIKTKCACFRACKALVKNRRLTEANEAKAAYNKAKPLAKRVVWQAKFAAGKDKFANISPNDGCVFKLAKQMDRSKQGFVGEKCVKKMMQVSYPSARRRR